MYKKVMHPRGMSSIRKSIHVGKCTQIFYLLSHWLVFWQMQFKKDQENVLFLVYKSNWKIPLKITIVIKSQLRTNFEPKNGILKYCMASHVDFLFLLLFCQMHEVIIFFSHCGITWMFPDSMVFTCILLDFPQVLEMFILVLQQCHKENEDKWKRLSRQIADIILPMLAKQQVAICIFLIYKLVK